MGEWFKRVYKKFKNAFRGLYILIKEEKSLFVHFIVTFLVIIFGIIFNLNTIEWAIIFLTIGIVIGFEIINTAIEYTIDIVTFEYNTKAKKVKDVAAMAALFTTIIAIIVGLLIFVPAIIEFVNSGII